jgi:DNA replication and repair protein RecF
VIVEQLSLVDFRNYAAADVTLDAGANVFVGRNGQGKTNLAEAIGFFATLGSHRVSQDAPMVRDGADAAIVRMRLAYGDRRVMLEAQVNRTGSNKARVNGSPVKTSELPRYAQVVLFAPEDLQIVRSDPPRGAASPISSSSSAHRAWRECSRTTTASSSSARRC